MLHLQLWVRIHLDLLKKNMNLPAAIILLLGLTWISTAAAAEDEATTTGMVHQTFCVL